ncbi:hypothetical protein SAMN02787118_102104 [Streptomyces mirabilis]|uniref:Uncharacterized protein n=1 Tax=Streptomyces mirabilis TaxID=68239 RepID=A0A1I2C882_9ACTN|nr:hypothetical protein SAMN02787118_102104 [Streptomyces mirabilis]
MPDALFNSCSHEAEFLAGGDVFVSWSPQARKGLPPSAGFFEGIFYESPSVPLAAAKSPATDSVLSALLASAE